MLRRDRIKAAQNAQVLLLKVETANCEGSIKHLYHLNPQLYLPVQLFSS
jgi:hypothetical protein